jgi:hypothetical protein
MKKLPTYRVFRHRAGGIPTVVQVRCPETGEAVSPCDLEGFRAKCKLDSPWYGVGIRAGSSLLLTPKTARFLLAAGTIAALEEPALIISRTGTEQPGGSTAPALETARKGSTSASPRNR